MVQAAAGQFTRMERSSELDDEMTNYRRPALKIYRARTSEVLSVKLNG